MPPLPTEPELQKLGYHRSAADHRRREEHSRKVLLPYARSLSRVTRNQQLDQADERLARDIRYLEKVVSRAPLTLDEATREPGEVMARCWFAVGQFQALLDTY